jgi:hypothetical protein
MLLKNGVTQPPRRVEAGRNFLLLGITLGAFAMLFMVYNVYRGFTSQVYYSDYSLPDSIRAADQAFTDVIFATILFLSISVGIPATHYFRNKGRRTLAPDAFAELDRLPDRRPVLFLRPFSRGPSNLPLYKVFEVGDWFELAVVQELRKNWPVIAIGKPGERLPPMGAGRFYVPDIHWEETVSWFLSECQLVMLVYGTTPGLLSELRMIVDQGLPSKLVLCIPEGGISTRKNRKAWRLFKEKTGNIFPKPLPDSPSRALFMRFDATWNPVIVVPSSRRGFLGSRAVRAALRTVLANAAELDRP